MAERVFLDKDATKESSIGEEIEVLLQKENNEHAANVAENRLDASDQIQRDGLCIDGRKEEDGITVKREANAQRPGRRPEEEKSGHVCTFCQQLFTNRKDLIAHQKLAHIKKEYGTNQDVGVGTLPDQTTCDRRTDFHTPEVNSSSSIASEMTSFSNFLHRLFDVPQRSDAAVVNSNHGTMSEANHSAGVHEEETTGVPDRNHTSNDDGQATAASPIPTGGNDVPSCSDKEVNDHEAGGTSTEDEVVNITGARCISPPGRGTVARTPGPNHYQGSLTDEDGTVSISKTRCASLPHAVDGNEMATGSDNNGEVSKKNDSQRISEIKQEFSSPIKFVLHEECPVSSNLKICPINPSFNKDPLVRNSKESLLAAIPTHLSVNKTLQVGSSELSDLGAIQSNVNLDFRNLFPGCEQQEQTGNLGGPFPVSITSSVMQTGSEFISETDKNIVVSSGHTLHSTGADVREGSLDDSSTNQCNSMEYQSEMNDTGNTSVMTGNKTNIHNDYEPVSTSSQNLEEAAESNDSIKADEVNGNTPNTLNDPARKYPCFYCEKTYHRASHRSDHERSHSESLQFKCSTCGKGFNRKRSLRRHEICHTINRPRFSCRKCKIKFQTVEEKEKHVIQCHESGKLQCLTCGKCFKSYKNLKEHERRYCGTRTRFECSHCDSNFVGRSELTEHKKNVHDIDIAFKYRCIRCKLYFKTREEKANHIKNHANERRYTCSYCGKGVKTRTHLQNHERTHDKNSQFPCLHCSKRFARKRELFFHEKRHQTCFMPKESKSKMVSETLAGDTTSLPTGINFKCWKCKMVFKNKAGKEKHFTNHISKATHRCTFCGKSFKYMSHRNEHEKTHGMEKRLTCAYCKSRFSGKRNLAVHLNLVLVSRMCKLNGASDDGTIGNGKVKNCSGNMPQIFLDAVSDNGKLPCSMCQLLFTDAFQLRVHEIITHVDQKGNRNGRDKYSNMEVKAADSFGTNKVLKEGEALVEGGCGQVETGDGIGVSELKEERRDEDPTNIPTQMETDLFEEHEDQASVDVQLVSICEFCDRTFRSMKGMLNHQKKKHTKSKEPYMCPDCPKTFATRAERDTHLRQHLAMRPFQCRFCPKRFKKAHHCREHELLHDVSSQLKCSYCEKGFTTKRYLQKHQLGKRSRKPLMCGECGKCFALKTCLMYHEKICRKEDPSTSNTSTTTSADGNHPDGDVMESEHRQSSKEGCKETASKEKKGQASHSNARSKEDSFLPANEVSSKCGKPASQSGDDVKFVKYLENMIDVHLRKELADDCGDKDDTEKTSEVASIDKETQEFVCKFCGVIFDTEVVLVKHEFLHTKKQATVCWYCNETFQTEELKKEHELSHQVQSCLCQLCGTFFKSHQHMEKHDCHNPQSKIEFSCGRCTEKFTKPEDLIQHESSHKGKRAYECTSCKARYVSSDSIEYHMQKEHGIMSTVAGKSRRKGFFSCRYCRKWFSNQSSLLMHENGHVGANSYSCYYCKKNFESRTLLLQHEDTHAAERPYQCAMCGLRFMSEFKMHNHAVRHRESEFRCEHCPRNFNQETDLFKHEKAHPDLKKYGCSCCDEKFACDLNRMSHARRLHKVTYPCPLCGQKLATSSALARHLIDHKKKNQTFATSRCHRFTKVGETLGQKSTMAKNGVSHPADENSTRGPLDGSEKAPTIIENNEETNMNESDCQTKKATVDSASIITPDSKHNEVNNSSKYKRKLRTRHPSQSTPIKARDLAGESKTSPSDTTGDQLADVVQEIVQCRYCGKDFQDQDICLQHEILHSPDKQWKCETCNTSYFTKKLLMEHVEMEQHKGHLPVHVVHDRPTAKESMTVSKKISFEITSIESIKGKDCQSVGNDQSFDLLDNSKTHFICIYCRRKFVSLTKYRGHKRTHFGDSKPYRCRYCGDLFETGNFRDIHETKHNDERPFKCRHCKHRAKSRWHRKEHEKTHTEAPQIKCEACQHCFRRPLDLWRHEKGHGDGGTHKCKKCSACFYNFRNLQYHWKLKHGAQTPPWMNQKTTINTGNMSQAKHSYLSTDCSKSIPIPSRRQAARLAKSNSSSSVARNLEIVKEPQWNCAPKQLNSFPPSERIVIHYPDTQHQCELCDKRFQRLIHVHLHEKDHVGIKNHKCPKCQARFFNKGSVNYHLQMNHGACLERMFPLPESETTTQASTNTVSKFQCKVCRKLYSNKSHLEEHERLHDPSLQFHCEVCGKSFTRLIRLWRHEVVHKGGQKKYHCTQCQAGFFSKGSHDYHIQRHHMVGLSRKQSKKKKYTALQQKPKVYDCPHCSKTFGNPEVAKRHEANHFHVLRHGCTYKGCDKRFALTAHVEQHARDVHKTDRPYQCSFCPKTFKTVGHFTYHEKRHQPDRLSYICEVCEKGFTRPRAVFRHENTHKGEKKYSCPKCSLRCHSMVSIMYHKLSKHGITYRQQGLHKLRDAWKSKRLSKNNSLATGNLAKQNERKRTWRKPDQPDHKVVQQKAQRVRLGKQDRVGENCKATDVAVTNCKVDVTRREDLTSPVQSEWEDEDVEGDDQSADSVDVNEDTSFICELCTEEFDSERELRRHKRFHSVEIKAMQSLFNNGATGQEEHPVSNLRQMLPIKQVDSGWRSKGITKRSSGRLKGKLQCLKKPSIKRKNARSKLIQRRSRRAAFRQGVLKLRTASQKSKLEASPEDKVAQVLKRLSWNTGIGSNPVVEGRFRIRSPVKKGEEKEMLEEEKKEKDEVVILDDEDGDNDDDVVEIPIEKKSPQVKKDVKNGHFFGISPKRRKDGKAEAVKSLDRSKSPKRQKLSNFLSLLKLTEKEREDGMAFVSRLIPVLYNGHCRSCIQCGKRFDTDSALAEHQKWHTCSKRIRCLECNMWCDNEKAYRAHWEEHALHRLLYCKHCGRDFPDKELLWRHEKTHNKDGSSNSASSGVTKQNKMEEKTYTCDMCSEAFVTAEELKVHQVSHTAPRAFVCEHCSMSFNQERQLRSHQTRHVGDLATWQKSFGCPLCGGMFRSSNELKSHERTFHGFEEKFECCFCDRTFGVEKNWRAHEEVHRSKKDTRKKKR